MHVHIGTSGFQYPEWKGKFYPATLAKLRMLPYYAEHFTSTESNYSFRSIPSRKTIGAWAAATPAGFKFSFKAPQKVTHFAKLRNCAETVRYFHEAIAPLGEKLGIVLFQLPPTFKKNAPLLASFLAELPSGMRAAFEFRHESWFDEEVFGCLRDRRAAFCIAESETLVTPPVVTADFGYLRLRREDYTPAQIRHWKTWLAKQEGTWSEAFVYFKHEEQAVGPKYAQQLQKLVQPARPEPT